MRRMRAGLRDGKEEGGQGAEKKEGRVEGWEEVGRGRRNGPFCFDLK